MSQAEDEFQDSAAELGDSLPDGDAFPEELPGIWEEDGNFEVGVGAMQAALYWQCAWLKVYVQAADGGDQEGVGAALDRLRDWVELEAVQAHLDPASVPIWLDDFVGSAVSGDDRLIREAAASC